MKWVCDPVPDLRMILIKIRISDRLKAFTTIRAADRSRSIRQASENGRATTASSENFGWIELCNEHRTHSTRI
jgi:hypothetical protein